jgi:uncharacterized integral membrane protein
MRKFLTALIVIPLGIVFIVFAVANRHLITVSFDPFNTVDPSLGVTLPLFVVIIAAVIIGVIAGGVATWFGQGRWRRASRRFEADATRTRRQLDELRSRQAATPPAQRLPALLQPDRTYGATERDRPRLTL